MGVKKQTHRRPTIHHHALVHNRRQNPKVPCHYQRKHLQHSPLHQILVAEPIPQLVVQKTHVVAMCCGLRAAILETCEVTHVMGTTKFVKTMLPTVKGKVLLAK